MQQVLGRAASVVVAFALVLALAASDVGKAAAANLKAATVTPSSTDAGTVWALASVDTSVAGSAIGPGSEPLTLKYAIRSTSSRPEPLSAVRASVSAAEGNAVDDATGEPIAGCLAAWFDVRTAVLRDANGTPIPLPVQVAPADGVVATVAVRMLDSGSRQDACQSARIRIVVSAE